MPVLAEKSVIRSKPPVCVPLYNNNPPLQKTSKKKKKGRRAKVRRQIASVSQTDQENDPKLDRPAAIQSAKARTVESIMNMKNTYKTGRQSKSDRSALTKLPSLPKSPTPSMMSQSATPRTSPGIRLPVTLPTNMQPGAHERRKKLPILAAIKPENEKSERERFIRANFNYNPLFVYRFPADSETLERLGKPSDKLMNIAILIMDNAIEKYGSYEAYEEQTGGKVIQRTVIMALIQRYLKREDLESEIMINMADDLLSRGSMTRVKGKPTLNIRTVNLRELWVEGLLRHEIGTHYLRSMNNRQHDWYNWKIRKDLGLKPANPTEEGLASLHSVLLRKDPCLWRAALLYYTAYKAAYMSLKELFKDLGQFVNDPYVRWDYCIRAKRGQIDTSQPGAFCKDQVYLDGAVQLLKNRKSINFHLLVQLGKISYEDIEKLELLADIEDTRIPFFMQNLTQYHKYLDRICEANGLTDEVLASV